MMWMLSPAEFVWMIRSFDCWAVSEEKDAVHRTIPARTVRPPRNTCLFVIFVIPLFREQVILLRHLSGDQVRLSGDTFATRATSPSLPSQMLSMSTNADPAARRTAGLHRDGNRRLPLRRADA